MRPNQTPTRSRRMAAAERLRRRGVPGFREAAAAQRCNGGRLRPWPDRVEHPDWKLRVDYGVALINDCRIGEPLKLNVF